MKKMINKESGFTLIEVVLVLAIGALIILMALLAFNGAQRSRRDTARTNLAGQIQAAVEQYAANNNGSYPESTGFGDLKTKNSTSWVDPKNGATAVIIGTTTPADAGITYVLGGTCTDAKTLGTVTATNTTQYAITYRQESNQTVCKSNTQ